MKTCKRTLAVLLCVLLVGIVPFGAYAENQETLDPKSETAFGAANAFDVIANNITSAEENEDYQVSYVSFKGNVATVDFSNAQPCLLVVAIYDEASMQLIASGLKEVDTEHLEEEVEIDIDSMPAHFVSKAFLLDANYAPLSKEYVNYENTTQYEEFLEKEPEDFSGDNVIVFDDEKDNPDFAVLTDETVAGEYADSMTFTYDEATQTFVFYHATSEVRGLKAGDVFYYEYGTKTNEFLLFKVKTISVSGSTVTIVEDTDIGLADVFSFVRIDSDGDYSDIELDESQLGAALELEEQSAPRTAPAKSDPDFDYNESNSWGTTFNLKWNIWSNGTEGREDEKDDAWLKASINGTLGYSFSTSVKLIYDVVLFGKDYYEFKSETKHEVKLLGISVTGTMALPEDIVRIPIPPIPVGPFTLKITVAPVAELSISINFDVTYTYKTVITADNSNGLQKTTETTSDWDASLDDEIEIKFGLVISFNLKFSEVVSLKLEGEGGIKYTGSTTTVGAWTDTFHNCRFCLYGDVNGFIDVKLTLGIKIIPKVLDFSWDAVKWGHEWYITDLYLSWGSDGKWSAGTGQCPSILHKVTFVVYTMENGAKNYLENATVTSSTGICDNDGDEKWDDHATATNEDGQAVFYFPAGEHSATAECDTYETASGDFKIISNAKQVELEMTKATSGYADGIGSADDLSNGGTQGGIIKFGAYPQTRETDSVTISALNSRASGWQSYGYYSGSGSSADGQMTAKDYMMYCDVKYGGNKYRGVTFSQYRPYYTGYTSSASYTYQDDNGYTTGTTYWFKYEPLQWKVLDPSEGLVMCVSLIDSQPYNNYILSSGTDPHGYTAYWGDAGKNHYANDYENSSLREWLNETFYATAFTESQQNRIAKNHNHQNNDGCYTLTGNTNYTDYDSNPTNDKIFLLSYDEVLNSSYGFSSSYSTYDTARRAKGTDYAKCQGLYVYSGGSYTGNSWWWLRSPGIDSGNACDVSYYGHAYSSPSVDNTRGGVRPACVISNLSSGISKSVKTTRKAAPAAKAVAETGTGIYQYSYTACVAGNDYILLNVTGYGSDFTLTTSNLEYIDQLTADESGAVSGVFLPRQAVAGSTTLLIGDFGNGTEARQLTATEHTHIDNDRNCTCDLCGQALTHVFTNYLPDGNATCNVDGTKTAICDICGKATDTIPDEDSKYTVLHQYEWTDLNDAICIANGHRKGVCSVCGNEVVEEIPDTATGHKESEWLYPEGFDCETGGVRYKECTVCHQIIMMETIEGRPHSQWIDPEVPATCTSEGLSAGIHCERCGKILVPQVVLPAGNHQADENGYATLKPATCIEDGEQTATCAICGEMFTEPIPATGEHADADNDGYCDTCEQQMTGGQHCKYCGKIHGGAFGWLVKFFHSIFAIFKR